MNLSTSGQLLLTIAAAMAGGYLALRLRIPAGALTGSMIAAAALNILFNTAYVPPGWKFYTQIATGAYIGAKISREDAAGLRIIIKPAVILSAVMISFTVGVSLIICQISDLTIATALFGTAPAGITDMTLASMEFDAEPSVVALLQTARIIFTICLMPPIIRAIEKRRPVPPAEGGGEASAAPAPASRDRRKSPALLPATLGIALVFGGLGKAVGIPAGAIVCSTLACAAYNIFTGKAYMPLRLRQFIQVFAGALIGCSVGREQALKLLEMYQVVALAVAGFTLLDLAAAWLIQRWTSMDMITALFASAPGGVTDMALIAEDMGADSVKVTGMHTVRLIGVISLYPALISVLLRFL